MIGGLLATSAGRRDGALVGLRTGLYRTSIHIRK